MSSFSDILPEGRDLVAGLLYRAGVWMSHTDDEESGRDDALEMRALERILDHIAKTCDASPLVQEAARVVLSQKNRWPGWADDSFDIIPDCENAMKFLGWAVGKQDVKQYRAALLSIAETVACAYGEYGVGLGDDGGTALSRLFGKLTEKINSGDDSNDFTNISPAEQDALDRLDDALYLEDEE